MTISYQHASRAEIGARRHQEDACAFAVMEAPASTIAVDALSAGGVVAATPVSQPETTRKSCLLAVLADGMGGHVGGAHASSTACKGFVEAFGATTGSEGERLITGLELANQRLAREVAEDASLTGMGCTLVAAVFSDRGVRWVSVGDSHLFLFRAGELFHLNENHSLAPVLDKLVEDGEMSREQALAHPRRHYLRSALTGEEIELVDLAPAAIELEAGDCVILASDGIDTLDADEIADIVASRAGEDAEAIVAALIDAVLAARQTYQDNTTVMVVRVVG